MIEPNLRLPGHDRYQPKDLQPYFGYDRNAMFLVDVEVAVMQTLGEAGIIPAADFSLLTPEMVASLHEIRTTEMDIREREVTRHDIRALVQLIQERLPEPLRRWAHIPLTSYDVIETARAYQFMLAHQQVVRPKTVEVVRAFIGLIREYHEQIQIGRTHGQHALPITVGFWLATILNRILNNALNMDKSVLGLRGKISGAVGAYNAQIGLGIDAEFKDSFELAVLKRLGLGSAPISTQILQPEHLARYLFDATLLSATFAQFGRDARHLMRTEIGEIGEPFEPGQVGSSTMAHKRNPITWENLEGMGIRTMCEFGKVLATLISEHQRDLVGSSVARDFPIIIVNLVQQLDTLLRGSKSDTRPFLARLRVDRDACLRNFQMSGDAILAEPLYLALQMHGYPGDAHHLVNHQALALARADGTSLVDAVETLAGNDEELDAAWRAIPHELHTLLRDPARYTGQASERALLICELAETAYLKSNGE